ncbi:MBL fold metallo-hydrolase [Bacillus sp. J14TS2]|uniref:MBL fold metallo-hydrolase n=1 Tax=Bacillus sp. J14TS2 TaxID=2807188 RepID=UPI001B2E07C7|nr:MBL fold metallo-hydrolase [Bacillus sp. J14TS2]GIN74560.1 MBL fold metallo-hydrolase [Bacillus sp. J14TS2]
MLYKQDGELINEIKNTNTYKAEVAIWSLGQSGIILKGENGFICIDPYLTYSIELDNPDTEFKRSFPPPLSPEQLAGIDGVLITHFHDDHMNLETLQQISQISEKTSFVAPASHSSWLSDIGIHNMIKVANDSSFVAPASHSSWLSDIGIHNMIKVANDSSFHIESFTIIPIEVAHTRYERDQNGNPYYFGYFIEVNGVKVFHSGDTIATKEIIDKVAGLQPDIVFVPINGTDYSRTSRGIIGNMNYREAVDFGIEVGADLIIPMHYDMFPNNSENPAYFVDYIFHHYPSQKFHMMVAGERFIYRKEQKRKRPFSDVQTFIVRMNS